MSDTQSPVAVVKNERASSAEEERRVSLAEVVRIVVEKDRSDSESISLASLYLSLRIKRISSKEAFSSLLDHTHGLELLKAALDSSGIHDPRTSECVDGIDSTVQTNLQTYKRVDNPVKKAILDQQQLSKLINMKLRTSQPGMRIEQDTLVLIGDAARQRAREVSLKLVQIMKSRCASSGISTQMIRVYKQPKDRIRELNLKLSHKSSLRQEEEHQKLLQLGDISGKRKRKTSDDEYDEDLLIRAEKAREEEEERRLADAANEATRSALGDAKYLKWFDKPQQRQGRTIREVQKERESSKEPVVEIVQLEERDLSVLNATKVALCDVVGVLKAERIFSKIFCKLLDRGSVSLFKIGDPRLKQ